jgi:hypothetical protein
LELAEAGEEIAPRSGADPHARIPPSKDLRGTRRRRDEAARNLDCQTPIADIRSTDVFDYLLNLDLERSLVVAKNH